jgi:hypothetical protein
MFRTCRYNLHDPPTKYRTPIRNTLDQSRINSSVEILRCRLEIIGSICLASANLLSIFCAHSSIKEFPS